MPFDLSPETGLWGLFLSAFVSATILPGNSEIALVAVLAKFPQLFWEAIVVATIGNTLGGMTSYLIGRIVPNKAEGKALAWLRRYGEWTLLLSWVPLIGDALCVAAGWLRINPWLALAMLAIGKCARYLVLALGWAMVGANAFT
ncbi:MAG: DedA family protein [Betaproteobacteria bacterium]|nr:DedA family protein [Betaproteobacteria bacterium]